MKSSIPFGLDCCASSGSRSSLPLVKQAKLIGVLYLENNLASHVFTPSRISVLELLASQAAISLENARLYNDLGGREARIRRLADSKTDAACRFWSPARFWSGNETRGLPSSSIRPTASGQKRSCAQRGSPSSKS